MEGIWVFLNSPTHPHRIGHLPVSGWTEIPTLPPLSVLHIVGRVVWRSPGRALLDMRKEILDLGKVNEGSSYALKKWYKRLSGVLHEVCKRKLYCLPGVHVER